MTPKQCRHCKKRAGDLIDSTSTYKKKHYYYWACRQCNTKRLRKYRSTPSGEIAYKKASYKTIRKHKCKQKARQKLAWALLKGVVIRPLKCHCGETKVEGHHTDYSKPLDVLWLCRSCHADEHRRLKML